MYCFVKAAPVWKLNYLFSSTGATQLDGSGRTRQNKLFLQPASQFWLSRSVFYLSVLRSNLNRDKLKEQSLQPLKALFAPVCTIWILITASGYGGAPPPSEMRTYVDQDYGYSFRYPPDWKLENMPEGQANRDIRVVLKGPNASSLTVVVERGPQNISKAKFEADPDRAKRVETLIQQITAQVYGAISKNLKAEHMKVGESHDLSNQHGIKFYVATLNTMKRGSPVIVAGIHSYPFSKDYSINFMLTTFWDSTASKENEVLMTVFNSFRLAGER